MYTLHDVGFLVLLWPLKHLDKYLRSGYFVVFVNGCFLVFLNYLSSKSFFLILCSKRSSVSRCCNLIHFGVDFVREILFEISEITYLSFKLKCSFGKRAI